MTKALNQVRTTNLTDRQDALASLRNKGITKVEIQVITVVMHAWSEVEHDIIYKNKHRVPESSRMSRMLDSINGLSSMQFQNFKISLSPPFPTVRGV
jgi:ppGpp synthetase/RelA/SpoT-type nucleotidyltranferase